jgi:hypothetical protein
LLRQTGQNTTALAGGVDLTTLCADDFTVDARGNAPRFTAALENGKISVSDLEHAAVDAACTQGDVICVVAPRPAAPAPALVLVTRDVKHKLQFPLDESGTRLGLPRVDAGKSRLSHLVRHEAEWELPEPIQALVKDGELDQRFVIRGV